MSLDPAAQKGKRAREELVRGRLPAAPVLDVEPEISLAALGSELIRYSTGKAVSAAIGRDQTQEQKLSLASAERSVLQSLLLVNTKLPEGNIQFEWSEVETSLFVFGDSPPRFKLRHELRDLTQEQFQVLSDHFCLLAKNSLEIYQGAPMVERILNAYLTTAQIHVGSAGGPRICYLGFKHCLDTLVAAGWKMRHEELLTAIILGAPKRGEGSIPVRVPRGMGASGFSKRLRETLTISRLYAADMQKIANALNISGDELISILRKPGDLILCRFGDYLHSCAPGSSFPIHGDICARDFSAYDELIARCRANARILELGVGYLSKELRLRPKGKRERYLFPADARAEFAREVFGAADSSALAKVVSALEHTDSVKTRMDMLVMIFCPGFERYDWGHSQYRSVTNSQATLDRKEALALVKEYQERIGQLNRRAEVLAQLKTDLLAALDRGWLPEIARVHGVEVSALVRAAKSDSMLVRDVEVKKLASLLACNDRVAHHIARCWPPVLSFFRYNDTAALKRLSELLQVMSADELRLELKGHSLRESVATHPSMVDKYVRGVHWMGDRRGAYGFDVEELKNSLLAISFLRWLRDDTISFRDTEKVFMRMEFGSRVRFLGAIGQELSANGVLVDLFAKEIDTAQPEKLRNIFLAIEQFSQKITAATEESKAVRSVVESAVRKVGYIVPYFDDDKISRFFTTSFEKAMSDSIKCQTNDPVALSQPVTLLAFLNMRRDAHYEAFQSAQPLILLDAATQRLRTRLPKIAVQDPEVVRVDIELRTDRACLHYFLKWASQEALHQMSESVLELLGDSHSEDYPLRLEFAHRFAAGLVDRGVVDRALVLKLFTIEFEAGERNMGALSPLLEASRELAEEVVSAFFVKDGKYSVADFLKREHVKSEVRSAVFSMLGKERILATLRSVPDLNPVGLESALQHKEIRQHIEELERNEQRMLLVRQTFHAYLKEMKQHVKLRNKIDGTPIENYYVALGVPRDATPEQITTSRDIIYTVFHSDRFTKDPQARGVAENIVKAAGAAYETLIDIQGRKEYDQLLAFSGYVGNVYQFPRTIWFGIHIADGLFKMKAARLRESAPRGEIPKLL